MPMHVAVAVSGRGTNLEALLHALGPGAPARVVRLRGYGNAINAQAARVFIEACQ